MRTRPPAPAAKRWRKPAIASNAAERPSRDVMKDIAAVEWLPLSAAVRRLSYPLKKLFLSEVGRRVLKRRPRKAARRLRRKPRKKTARRGKSRNRRRQSGNSRNGRSRLPRPAAQHPRPTILQRVLGRLAR